MFDWTQYTGNFGWLPKRTIFLTRHGSHAYGVLESLQRGIHKHPVL